jgi:hypothetical protein
VPERRRALAADDRGSLVNEIVVLEGLHHEYAMQPRAGRCRSSSGATVRSLLGGRPEAARGDDPSRRGLFIVDRLLVGQAIPREVTLRVDFARSPRVMYAALTSRDVGSGTCALRRTGSGCDAGLNPQPRSVQMSMPHAVRRGDRRAAGPLARSRQRVRRDRSCGDHGWCSRAGGPDCR